MVIYKAAPVKNYELVIADHNRNGASANAEGRHRGGYIPAAVKLDIVNS